MPNATKTFRSLLQNIVCERYADTDAALAEIDTEYQGGNLTETQRRALSAKAREAK